MNQKKLILLFICIGMLAVIAGAIAMWSGRMPGDDDVRGHFALHRKTLTQLRDLMVADRSTAVQLYPDGPKAHVVRGDWLYLLTASADDLRRIDWDAARAEKYIALMRASGVSRIDRGWSTPSNSVAFVLYSSGNVVESMTKQIVWSPAPPSPIAERDDQQLPDNSESYRPIEGEWYVRTVHD